ncbi:nitroreductase family protein [Desulfopila sp. IMCC35008]|uniref:nitroreductase family protein n=1 Tax=Desulfopila sp. IMCC35008 TaxID=2653858 RepID=UPI0013D7F142|nr:nitroreductase family protein [Desulfopila sp. IMCC35008]
MAIPTSRTKESPEIRINSESCNGCGLCVSVCSDSSLIIENDTVKRSDVSLFECIGCGHCMAICPTGAIEIYGRELSPEDVYNLPAKDQTSNYEQLLATLQYRRSIRAFEDRNVEPEIIDKILIAAKTAPMGLPPSDVNVLIFNGTEKTRAFAKDFSLYLKSIRFMFNTLFLALMRPVWGKETDEVFRKFLKPLYKAYTEDGMDKGINNINYDAPLAMYFYGSPYCDPADPIIAATYAMIAAESLGLGTCMLGAVHPFIQNGRKAKKFREDHNIKCKSREGLFVAFGYHKSHYQKGIRRTFASIEFSD